MAPLTHFLPLLTVLLGAVAASPISDPQVHNFLTHDDASVTPLTRRQASDYQTRHLRMDESEVESSHVKRDATPTPDMGQIASFDGGVPQPIRGVLGDTFLSNSNHDIDKQNVDNVAAPTTDAGTLLWQHSPRRV